MNFQQQTNLKFKKIISAVSAFRVSGSSVVKRPAWSLGFAKLQRFSAAGLQAFARFQQRIHLTLPNERD